MGYGQVIIHTTDGGVTWTTVPTSLTEQQFYVVRFLDQMHGWIGAQNTILYTNDGGLTWNQGTGVTGDVTGLAFADLQNGFAAEGGYFIFRTRDGGHTWSQVQLPVAVSNIRFFDSQRGVASESGFACEIRECGVLHTSDGGNTWTLQSGSTHGGFFISPTEGWNGAEELEWSGHPSNLDCRSPPEHSLSKLTSLVTSLRNVIQVICFWKQRSRA